MHASGSRTGNCKKPRLQTTARSEHQSKKLLQELRVHPSSKLFVYYCLVCTTEEKNSIVRPTQQFLYRVVFRVFLDHVLNFSFSILTQVWYALKCGAKKSHQTNPRGNKKQFFLNVCFVLNIQYSQTVLLKKRRAKISFNIDISSQQK